VEVMTGPLLVVDAAAWYDVPDGYAGVVTRLFEPMGFQVVDGDALARRVARALADVLRHGDLVVAPTMSGCLCGAPTAGRVRCPAHGWGRPLHAPPVGVCANRRRAVRHRARPSAAPMPPTASRRSHPGASPPMGLDRPSLEH